MTELQQDAAPDATEAQAVDPQDQARPLQERAFEGVSRQQNGGMPLWAYGAVVMVAGAAIYFTVLDQGGEDSGGVPASSGSTLMRVGEQQFPGLGFDLDPPEQPQMVPEPVQTPVEDPRIRQRMLVEEARHRREMERRLQEEQLRAEADARALRLDAARRQMDQIERQEEERVARLRSPTLIFDESGDHDRVQEPLPGETGERALAAGPGEAEVVTTVASARYRRDDQAGEGEAAADSPFPQTLIDLMGGDVGVDQTEPLE